MYSHRTIFLSVSLLFCILSINADGSTWSDCAGGSVGAPSYQQVAVFPNPVQVGQTLHVRAVVVLPDLGGQTLNGSLNMEILYTTGNVQTSITNISLCDSTDAIDCSDLKSGSNAISFDYYVPQVPAGDYTINIKGPSTSILAIQGCLQLFVKVTDPTQNGINYLSYIEAGLAGQAHFSNSNYTQRQLGDVVQVGPIGIVNPTSSLSYAWGTFISVEGSQDTILPNADLTGLVWGFSGNMTTLAFSTIYRATTYTGNFYLGYVQSYTQKTLTTPILDGTFSLTWNYTNTKNGLVTVLTGTLNLNEDAVLPLGWQDPLVYKRLGTFSVYTSAEGILTVKASTVQCTSGQDTCEFSALQSSDGKKSLSNSYIALAIALPTGIVLLVVLGATAFLWLRHRRNFEEEDGIFSAARKPEYGNALVVDDIIQETREHSPELIPRLNRQPGDYSDDEYERQGRRSRRNSRRATSMSRSRTPSRSDSVSPSRSRSRSASRSYSDEDSYSGSSASRD